MNKAQILPAQSFGELFRLKRIGQKFTLRSFCARFGFDPGYISRIERNLIPPPEDKDKLVAMANALGIKKDSSVWVNFFDLGYLARGKVPADILAKPQAPQYLPLLFRTARGKKLSKKKLQELIRLINAS